MLNFWLQFLMSLNLCAMYRVVWASEDYPQVQIKQGALKGIYRQAWKGKTYSSFTGIPYAKPPVGELRFEPPIPAESWTNILDATKPHAICTQINVLVGILTPHGKEDCLYLNVYTPIKKDYESYKFPVMVFIHGGAWTCGNGNLEYYGPDYLLEDDVLLVVINYRVGAFGFLSTEDDTVSGNNGLKDQTMALRWVNENIGHFGGDVNRVTIFGQSAGAVSVALHLFSPLSRGLFSGAIAQSGSPLASWAVAKPGSMAANAKNLAKLLNCPTNSNYDMVRCLKIVEPYDIVSQDLSFYVFAYDPMSPYMPVIEKETNSSFLTADPKVLMKAGKIADVPFMTGLTSEDGAVKSAEIYSNATLIKIFDKDFNKLLPIIFNNACSTQIAESIRKFYVGNKKIDGSEKAGLGKLFTDYFFTLPAETFVRNLVQYSNQQVYYYLFGFRGTVSIASLFGDLSYDYGVCHGDEFYYLLSSDYFLQIEPNESERLMRDIMVKLWTNFAKFATPTPETNTSVLTMWSAATENGDFYYIKGPTEITMNTNLFSNRMEFWNSVCIPPLHYSNVDNYTNVIQRIGKWQLLLLFIIVQCL